MSKVKVIDLERKVNLIMRGLNLLLFREGEVIPKEKAQELKARLENYPVAREFEFVRIDRKALKDLRELPAEA